MNKIDLIIDALSVAQNSVWSALNQEALAYAIELKLELAKPEQKPLKHAIIAGVLFDFMGWLTSRQERLVLSSCDDASPAVKVIEEFAKMRGLSLDDAKVKDWQDITAPPRKEWVGLTINEVWDVYEEGNYDAVQFARAIESRLKELNT